MKPQIESAQIAFYQANGYRIWHDQALFNPPYGNPTGWHLDDPYWSFSSRDAISVWVALDDATRDNGCLYYLPGSHKMARFDNHDNGNASILPGEYAASLKVGDALGSDFNPLIWSK